MVDWGSVPDWLAGVGTVGTLGVAVGVLARESRDRRRREEYERGSQARAVRLGPLLGGRGGSGQQEVYADKSYSIELHNGSGDAVHDVILTLQVPSFDLYDPSDSPITYLRQDVLAAGETVVHRFSVRIKWPSGLQMMPDSVCLPHLTFTDMSHQVWIRDGEYRLRLLTSQELVQPPLHTRIKVRLSQWRARQRNG